MEQNDKQYWTTEISPKSFAKGFGLKELWQKKYLIWLFIKRDITVQFKQTIFGMGWYFISPLFSMFMYIVVFGRIAGIPTDDIPQPVFYLSGSQAGERRGFRELCRLGRRRHGLLRGGSVAASRLCSGFSRIQREVLCSRKDSRRFPQEGSKAQGQGDPCQPSDRQAHEAPVREGIQP